MHYLKLISTALFSILIAACNHPIEIVGDGDVTSASGNRNCYLEDYRAGKDNCTKNTAVGAYYETYSAEPRAGWAFDSWQGCLTPVGDSCNFNIPADTVKKAWGQVIPPLVAVFTRDTDSDGTPDFRDRDDDADGMPDDWEILNDLDPLDPEDSSDDADFDSNNNLREYCLGTDPRDTTSLPVGNYLIEGVATDAEWKGRLSDVKVKVEYTINGNTLVSEVKTDTSGKYQLRFDSANLPEEFLITASRVDYVPNSINISKEVCSKAPVNFLLTAIDTRVIVLEIDPTLHHLGNDYFSGTINSQFQKSTEGLLYTRKFTLASDQLYYNVFTMKLVAKGLQVNNPISINGEIVGYLNNSASSGYFSNIDLDIAKSALQMGENVLSIESAYGLGDYDDFEFSNILLELGPQSETLSVCAQNLHACESKLEQTHRKLVDAKNLKEMLSYTKDFAEILAAFVKAENLAELAATNSYFQNQLNLAELDVWNLTGGLAVKLYVDAFIERPLRESLAEYWEYNLATSAAATVGAATEAIVTGGTSLPSFVFDQSVLILEAAFTLQEVDQQLAATTLSQTLNIVNAWRDGKLDNDIVLEQFKFTKSLAEDYVGLIAWPTSRDTAKKMWIVAQLAILKVHEGPESLPARSVLALSSTREKILKMVTTFTLPGHYINYADKVARLYELRTWPYE